MTWGSWYLRAIRKGMSVVDAKAYANRMHNITLAMRQDESSNLRRAFG